MEAPRAAATLAEPRISRAWRDGAWVEPAAIRPAADPARTCYTTGRFEAGRVRLEGLVAGRLAHDAEALGLGPLDPARVARALRELGTACFGPGAGVVRLEARPGGRPSEVSLVGTVRALGPEPAHWRAVTAAEAHPGPGPAPGAKQVRPTLVRARRALEGGGADEALLYDAAGRLVEGTRTSLVVVGEDGVPATPADALGGVTSVAREALRGAGIALREAELGRDVVARAREIVALNAVRGARPVLRLDEAPVGSGEPGPVATELAARLAELG